MIEKRRFMYAAVALLTTALPLQSAVAACKGAFKPNAVWHLHVIEVGSGDGAAIRCVAKFGAAGAFTAPCINFETGSSTTQSANVSGKLALKTSCDFTGSVTIPGDSKVVVRFGHVNGVAGSAIATQGTGAGAQVLQINMIRR